MSRSEDALEMPALGRPFQLGMLYDCRKDALIPGITLWDLELLQKDVSSRPQPKTEFELIASDSIDDKAYALNVSASLKASFLGGLVEVGGSAKYFQDTKKSKHQARVTLQYKTTTRYEQLTMSHLGIQNVSHPTVFEHGTATHVVTAILYGAQAFFVFDRKVSSSESVQEIEGNLQVVINKLISLKGEAEIQMDEKEKSQAQNFSCKFHGDFSLESNPVSFQDAMQVYTTLPKMMGEDGKKAVPITVWLYPLTKMDSRAAKMVREISLALIFDAQKILEELNETDMRCSDLAKNPIADTFPEIKKKILHFKDLCKQHRQTFQKELARILPSIRGGGKEEQALVDILRSVSQSPFNSRKLNEFLDTKERENHFVKSYLTILSDTEIISSQSKLEEIVLDPQNEFVICFAFTSLHVEEPFLSSLQLCLQIEHLEEKANSKCKPWYEHKETKQKARKAAKSISDFARVNKSSGKTRFVMASVPDEENPGASIYLYEDGELVSSSFDLPPKPLPLLLSGIKHDQVQLTFQPAEYGRANITSYRVEYRIAGEETWKAVNTEDSRETFLLKGLSPNREYQFQYAARCKPGHSETSETSKPVKTLPTSPPGKPREVTVGSCMVSISWGSPSVIGEGVLIKEYKVEYREEAKDKDRWNEIKTGRKAEFCEIGGLRPQTFYRLRVTAVYVDGIQSAPSEGTDVYTSQKEEEEKGRLALKYVQTSKLVAEGQPSVYVLPLKMASDDKTSCLTYHLGKENLGVPNKVIMVMGATGSGKTTLINGMVNYILGVRWEDSFRFKLIHEETNRSQAESQASEMKVYVLNHQMGFQIPYSLTIIDTPEFGDTGGTEHSISLTREIRRFLSTLQDTDHLDAICIVLQASLACLTPAQRYVFDSVLSLLGKDMKDNIQVLVTFVDGQTLPVLETIKTADVPCAKDASGTPVHFKFSNSALFAHNAVESGGSFNFDEMFWKMDHLSVKTFLDSLNTLESKSLILTKEVLRERKVLEASVESLQSQIKAGLVKLEELEMTQQVLDQNKEEMKANRKFEYEVAKTAKVVEDISGTSNVSLNCRNCQLTCFYPCKPVPFNFSVTTSQNRLFEHLSQDLIYTLSTMSWQHEISPQGRVCKVCPGRCLEANHKIGMYRFEQQVFREKKYEHAFGEVCASEKMLLYLRKEYEKMRERLDGLVQKYSQSHQRLQEMALKHNPLLGCEGRVCKVCPGRCLVANHTTEKYRFEQKVFREKKTKEDMRKKYEHAFREVCASEKMLLYFRKEYEKMREGLDGLVQKSSQSLQRLQEMALKPNPLLGCEYFDVFIMLEEQELKPGYQERIELWKKRKEEAEIMQKVAKKEPLLPEN